jgi:hypothetical protein
LDFILASAAPANPKATAPARTATLTIERFINASSSKQEPMMPLRILRHRWEENAVWGPAFRP